MADVLAIFISGAFDYPEILIFRNWIFISELYYMSYKLEPPQSTYEKDEYKKLKTLRKASKMI